MRATRSARLRRPVWAPTDPENDVAATKAGVVQAIFRAAKESNAVLSEERLLAFCESHAKS